MPNQQQRALDDQDMPDADAAAVVDAVGATSISIHVAPPAESPATPAPNAASTEQSRLRQLIFRIQADTSLDPLEKARRMQALMMARFSQQAAATPTLAAQREAELRQRQQTALTAANDMLNTAMDAIGGGGGEGGTVEQSSGGADHMSVDGGDAGAAVALSKPVDTSLQPSYHVTSSDGEEGNQELGCKHYRRGAKFRAQCCGEWFVCRFCHDESCGHAVDRKQTDTMLCMHCLAVQPAAQDCIKCSVRLGQYYCNECHLWDNDPAKKIYHCEQCGICRVGEGLGIDYFHCDKCNVCMSLQLQDKHRCIERNLESDCPICGEYMFTSTHTVIFMPCGHCIHWKCYQEHIRNSYQCPICWKSLADMGHYFRQIDQMLAQHKMPAEYEDFWSNILCNDCEHKTRTKYHFLYHKCQQCGSYNTKILSTEQERPEGAMDGNIGASGGGSSMLGADLSASQQAQQGGLSPVGGGGGTVVLTTRPRSSSAVSADSRQMIPDDNDRDGDAHPSIIRRLP